MRRLACLVSSRFCKAMKSNLQNRTIFCHDNLGVLQGINSKCVDLLYLDPPFNKKKVFTAPIGSHAEGASFKDYFREEDIKEEWLQEIDEDQEKLRSFLHGIRGIEGRTSYNFCYLAYMAIRLIECHRILKDTGSLYLHCDPTMSHYLKILLDCVFGEKQFRNEIVWCYTGPSNTKRYFPRKHDVIFFYAKDKKSYSFHLEAIRISYTKLNTQAGGGIGGRLDSRSRLEYIKLGKLPEDYWPEGRDGMTPVGRIKKERIGYPTQKPLALLERIIQASSKKGDLVLDPFCGCATTCIAAEKLGRKWIGIDVSHKAYELVQERLKKEVANPEELFDYKKALNYFTDPPKRTDRGKDYREQKYVYVISNKVYKDEYKVGIASDIQKRLNSYQTSDPNRGYKMEYKVLTHNFRDMEKYIHTELQSRHEWVKADLETIKKTMRDFDKS